jgi:hypothetical protein
MPVASSEQGKSAAYLESFAAEASKQDDDFASKLIVTVDPESGSRHLDASIMVYGHAVRTLNNIHDGDLAMVVGSVDYAHNNVTLTRTKGCYIVSFSLPDGTEVVRITIFHSKSYFPL